MLSNERDDIRQTFVDAWRKHLQQQPLQPLERLIASVIGDHPEYQSLLEDPESALSRDFLPDGGETNPFLHMGMHISLQEQLATDRPAGIVRLYRHLQRQTGATHATEHLMMECLGRELWTAQQQGRLPDEQAYLACVQSLLRGHSGKEL